MEKILILPINGVVLDNLKQGQRVYFLAGPIKGTNGWHEEAIKLLIDKDPNCIIACPKRFKRDHELFNLSIPSTRDSEDEVVEILQFENQTLWERHYIEIASYYGCVIFWLPAEDKDNPRKKEEGPYAQDTYGELGRYLLKSANPEVFSLNSKDRHYNVVVGAENNFPGLTTIIKNLIYDYKADIFVAKNTLASTIYEAVKLAKVYNKSPMNFND